MTQVSKENFLRHILSTLVPPGNGVYTVHTAKERRDSLQKSLYGENQDPGQTWAKSWEEFVHNPRPGHPTLLGICSDNGGGILRGANWGPLFLREFLYRELDPKEVFDLGDIRVIPHFLHDDYLSKEQIEKSRQALYGDQVSPYGPWPVSPLSIAEDFLGHFYQNFPQSPVLTLGGDHSISYPAVKEYLLLKKRQGIKAAVLHFDAHTDLLEERLGVPLCFGSWAYHVLPFLNSPALMTQIGIRSSGRPQQYWEKNYGVKQVWADEANTIGPDALSEKVIDHFKKNQVEEIYISFDIDALDEEYASATGTPESGGLKPSDCFSLITSLAREFSITGADLAEVAPFISHPEKTYLTPEPETTLSVGTSLIELFLSAMKGQLSGPRLKLRSDKNGD